MSKYDYSNWHEIKDLVAIYNEQEWDDAEVVVWDTIRQCKLRLVFCGSFRPEEGHEGYGLDKETKGEINFVAYPMNETEEDCDVSEECEHLLNIQCDNNLLK